MISDAQREVLFGITGDPNYDQARFLNSLGGSDLLLAGLRADSTKLAAFNALFGQTLATTGDPTPAQRDLLFGISGGAGFDLTTFLNLLVPTNNLLITIRSTTANRTAFNTVFNVGLASSGTIASTQRDILFGITGAFGYDQTVFINAVNSTNNLFTQLKTATYRVPFNTLFAVTLPTTGNIVDVAQRDLLFGITGTPGYVQSIFLNAVISTNNLLTALRANTSQRTAFNALFNQSLATTGAITLPQRQLLFGLTGDPGYAQATFTGLLVPTNTLVNALLADSAQLAAFNSLFGVALNATDPLNDAQKDALFGITGTSGYSQTTFLGSLIRTNDLYVAVKTNATRLAAFNALYNETISSVVALTGTQRALLFGITAGTTYNATTYTASLIPAGDILAGLRADTAKRAAFNLLYGQTLAATGAITIAQRTALLTITADALFIGSTNFLNRVVPARDLLTALRASSTKRSAFNTLYGVVLTTTSTPSEAHRVALFGAVATSGYNQTTYLNLLIPARDLLNVLRASSSRRTAFNGLFNTALTSTSVPTVNDRDYLFSVVSDTGYNQTTFSNLLVSTNNLLNALIANPTKMTAFNVRYGVGLNTTDPLNDAQKDTLFGITGTAGYNQTTFLAGL